MLIDKLLFSDQTPTVLRKNLDFEAKRNLLISSNISNINTPGYKAQNLNFKEELRNILGSKDGLSVKMTHKKHMGGASKEALKSLKPEIFDNEDAARSDGNNVSLDKEMSKLAENQIIYNATVQLMAKRGSTIKSAITEIVQQ